MRRLIVERRAHVRPLLLERGRQLLLGRDHDVDVLADQRERVLETLDRQQLCDVLPQRSLFVEPILGGMAILGGELRRGSELDFRRLAERALREGREPPQRVDLVPEKVDPHCAVRGHGKDIEKAAANSELAPVFDLVDALVSCGDEPLGAIAEVREVADPEAERARPQVELGHLLGECDRRHHH